MGCVGIYPAWVWCLWVRVQCVKTWPAVYLCSTLLPNDMTRVQICILCDWCHVYLLYRLHVQAWQEWRIGHDHTAFLVGSVSCPSRMDLLLHPPFTTWRSESDNVILWRHQAITSLFLWLTIKIQMSDGAQNQQIKFSCYHTKTNIVVLEDLCMSQEVFIMVKHMAKTFTKKSKRLDIKESKVVLAFPLTKGGEPKIVPQSVHAFLPVKSFGFSVGLLN